MKARVKIQTNYEEVERIKTLSIPSTPPEPIYKKTQFVFDIEDVKLAYITEEGSIFVKIIDEWFDVDYNEDVWNTICDKFK